MRGKGGWKGDRKLRGKGWEIRAYPMPGGGKRVRGGREIRLTQRENENEGRDVSTIDHRGSECNANHAPSLVPVPQRSRTYPRQLYLTRHPPLSLADSLTRLSLFRHQRPFCDTEPARYRL